MKFYYTSSLSVMLLGAIYLIGTLALIWWGVSLRKEGKKRPWIVIPPLLLLLYVAPIAEELQTAWTFGQLCKKDAGIFVYTTVEVDGFYNASRETHSGQPTRQAAEDFDKGGYRFYQLVLRNRKGGPNQVVHIEKVGGVWTATVLDQPTARYHYEWPHTNTPMGHRVDKIEEVVLDSQTNEVLARETRYRRRAPWFFIGLDAPVMLCPAPGEHPLQKYGAAYHLALKPIVN